MSLRRPRKSAANGFTIIEVMMASVILVVAFMGMIQAITVGSEMMATARRQTLAAQILEHEVGKMRLLPYATVSGYAAGPTAMTIDSRFDDALSSCGLTASSMTLSRTTSNVTTDLKEVTLTLIWTKSGSTAAATTPSGSWFDQIAFYRPTSASRTYTRKTTAFFGKYGLNNSIQR
ncbi:prepilin-type N-terminal cleavage/methylation domain-containing protein [Oleiharenicola lentus]|jgi:prepilin-type N-terminal cleavage/methylation domain-containing protein|uniref:Prepilin-type N-terminal cleavage/methylation domain-containing protein n=1 Tax=Oleiharenicola lentus TaxID=2508720 RepID=A0A4Q1C7E7_9BACT|nr:prepilin-type N-terminal cleavage/methylation domain-containing protein [Oleiharenicola lentus]RXK54833.1 prepilin-type N-terminal cleavage/methylation domain-containing protein [Oleiharenicola lentus]